MPKPDKAPKLKGKMTTTDAAGRLGVTRQSVVRMVHDGRFNSLELLGDKPIYVVKESEVEALKAKRAAAKEQSEEIANG